MLILVAVAGAACPASSLDLSNALDDAEAAWTGLDPAALREATDRAVAGAACLTESVPRATIARLHRTEGLRAFLDHDAERAGQAFAAARGIEPAYRFPESFVPLDHPVQHAYAAADPAVGAFLSLPPPVSGRLEFDGRVSQERPARWPTLAASYAEDGSLRATGYLWPADPMLPYDALPPSALPRRGPNLPLTVTALAGLAASGACWAVAKVNHDAYLADASRPEELRLRNNGFFVASVGAAVVGVGAGAGAVIAGRW